MSEKKVRETQCDLLLRWWELGYEWITPWEAMDLGIMRLAARIFDLRSKHGIQIEEETVYKKNKLGQTIHYSRYRRAA
jgi:hypothetical protein